MSAIKNYLHRMEGIAFKEAEALLDRVRVLKPFRDFEDLTSEDWDKLIHAVSPFRDLHQRLILTRCDALTRKKKKGLHNDLGALD